MGGYGLQGSVAFVTGAATGIGRATAERLASEGAVVVVADVNDAEARATLQMVEAAGARGMALHVDVNDPAQVEAAIDSTVSAFGRLDCAVNSAAISLGAERVVTAEVSLETFDRLLAVDLRGVFISMKYELRAMIAQGGGSIVNIGSGASVIGSPLNPSYVAAKHGVVGLTRAAAVDHARDGVRVNVVCPGVTETAMIAERPAGYRERINDAILMGRMATPDEIAHAIAWYCSPHASYATGSVVMIDGGVTAQ